jgi:hypothetical protein
MDSSITSKIVEHESRGKYSNNHCIHIGCGIATEQQIKTSIRRAIDTAQKLFNAQYDHRSRVSIVCDRNNHSYGYAYAWIVDSSIYNMLVGRNPDGSDRYEEIQDPSWRPPTEQDVQNFNCRSFNSWADEAEEEEELLQPKMIRRPLPPLIKLEPYELTSQQRSLPGFENSERGELIVTPGMVSDLDPQYIENVICANHIPDGVTAEFIKNEFKHYVSDPSRVMTKKVNGVVVSESYPLVRIVEKNSRTVFVTFDPSTHDAQWALKVSKKLTFDIKGKTHTIVFNRTFKNKDKAGPSSS